MAATAASTLRLERPALRAIGPPGAASLGANRAGAPGLGRCGWDLAAIVLLFAAAVVVLATFRDYGISNDEAVQHAYGEKLLRFYLSGFTDQDAFAFKDLFYYGGLFDLLVVLLDRVSPFATHETRHLLSAGFGLAGLAGACVCGRTLFGPRAGFLAALVLALTGAWWGGMFNHTKDIPFAVCMLWALWALCRIVRALPRPRVADVLAFGSSTGLGLGLRVGALLLVFYLGLAVLLWLAFGTERAPAAGARWRALGGLALRLAPAAAVAYALMALLWPWAVFDPLNPIRALSAFSNLDLGIQTILHGEVFNIDAMPRDYLPVYLAIKLPVLLLAGLAIAVLAGARCLIIDGAACLHRPGAVGVAIVAFAAGFPVLYWVMMQPPAYDGIRHFLFVVPPLAVLAGAGLDRLIAWSARLPWPLTALGGAAIAALALVQAGRLVLLHPYQSVDYNPLVGGPAGAQDRYVMDYWANSVPEAVRGLADYVRAKCGEAPPSFKVALCADRWAFEAVASPFLVWEPNVEHADFFVATTHMNCDAPEYWPRHLSKGRVVVEVERLGALLAVVKDRRSEAICHATPAGTPGAPAPEASPKVRSGLDSRARRRRKRDRGASAGTSRACAGRQAGFRDSTQPWPSPPRS